MADPIDNNLGHYIRELTLITKVGNFDITDKFEELNIYDSIFTPCMTGNILITDAIDMSSTFNFDGSELIKVDIGKNQNFSFLTKSFKIYQKGKTIPLNSTSEQYILYFVSEEFYVSKTQKLNKVYNERTYSSIVQEILSENLSLNYGYRVEETTGLVKYPSNNRSPIDCIYDITKKAISAEDQSPTFVFFENKDGYNFTSLSNIAKQIPITKINYEPKLFGVKRDDSFSGARYMEVVSQFDVAKNIETGVYGSRGVFVDILNRKIVTKDTGPISFNDKSKQLNKTPDIAPISQALNPNLCTRLYYGPTVSGTLYNDWIKDNNPTFINTIDDSTKYLTERPALMSKYTSKRVKLVMPGNFNLMCGTIVDLSVSSRSQNMESDSEDDSLSGKYIVLACRNIIKYDRHETIIEISTDSNNKKQLYKPVQE